MHIPDGISFEEACTVGVGIGTTGYGLYKVLGLPLPEAKQEEHAAPILIYGGSTATGTIAIQFAKLRAVLRSFAQARLAPSKTADVVSRSGRKVITTCSPKHFALMKELGADEMYDYVCPSPRVRSRAVPN